MIRKPEIHTLYLSAGGLLALELEETNARVAMRFDLPEGDHAVEQDLHSCPGALAFKAWVESRVNARFQLLIDHVDEQHAIEKLPKLGFRDRAALIAKRFNQQFRDSEFRITSPIPRQAGDSKKEERLVMMALKSTVRLEPWLDILLQAKARVSLMTSPSLLSSALIKSIAPGQSGLLISHHPAGLRQTLIIGGTVRFSRLARLKAYDAANVKAEILRSVQYLTMTQRLPASVFDDEQFTVWLLEDAINDANHFPASLALDSGSSVSIKRFKAEQLNLPRVTGAEGLSVWVGLCQRDPGQLNYVNSRVDVFERLANWRKRLWTGAAVVASAGLLLALLTDDIVDWHGHQMGDVRRETSRLQASMAQLREQLSKLPTTPEDIKAVVRISERLVANEAEPVGLLEMVSSALVQTEGLTLSGISFSADDSQPSASGFATDGNHLGIGTGGEIGNTAGGTPSLLASQLKLTVSGLADRELSRTNANNQIRLLADALASQCACAIAQVDLPFDASAQSGLTASLNDQFSQNREFKITVLRQQPAAAENEPLPAGYTATQPGLDDLMSTMSVAAMEAEHE